MTTTLDISPSRTRPSLPGYAPGLALVCVIAGFIVAWSTWNARPTSDPASLVGQADPILVDALRADDTVLFAEANLLYLEALNRDSANPEALRGAAITDLGLHRFELARQRATQATEARPNDHIASAALVDANVELGDYAAAEIELDRLLSLRPGLEAFSRLSYVRQLTGDDAGALQAMLLARSTASALPLETARIDALIGELEFVLGDASAAGLAYERAVAVDATRLDAMVGIAAVAFSQGDVDSALEQLEAVFAIDDGDIAALILEAEIAASLGQDARSRTAANTVGESALGEHDAGFGIDPSAALAVSSWGDPAIGLELASIIYDDRPDNIKAAHAYAWALYQVGRADEAVAPMMVATQFNTTDPVLARHAELILGR